MTPRAATLVGLSAILMWSLLAVLTVATGRIPAFQLLTMSIRRISSRRMVPGWSPLSSRRSYGPAIR
jgi:hypothetical protein